MYKQIAIPFFFIVVIVSTGYIIYWMSKSKAVGYSTKKTILSLLFLWYLCALAAITVLPFRASRTQNLDHHFNFVPVIKSYQRFMYVREIDHPQGIRNFRNNFAGNILMFTPLGIFLPLLYRKKIGTTILIAASSSLLIEFIQYLNMRLGYYRYVDVDDVILNTLGALIGYFILKLATSAYKYSSQ